MADGSYFGGKGGSGVYQQIINWIPPHRTLVIPFAGHCAVSRRIVACERLILCDRDPEVQSWWESRLPEHAVFQREGLELLKVLAEGSSDSAARVGVLGRPDEVVIYCDPPYHPDTRTSDHGYRFDWTAEDHDEFLSLVRGLAAVGYRVLISGYNCETYNSELSDWVRKDFNAMTRGGVRVESLWRNYEFTELHDYQYLGGDRRERHKLVRRDRNLIRRLQQLPKLEHNRLVMAVVSEFGVPAEAPISGAAAGGPGNGVSRETRNVETPAAVKRLLSDLATLPAVTPPREASQESVDRQLVLSLFSGVGLLDRAFSSCGFVMCSGPELITGGDVRTFTGVPGRFDGIVAGPPCQGFSAANQYRSDGNHPSVVNSRRMLQHTCRIIAECAPTWFVIENVPGVPDVRIDGYQIQRLNVSDWECGGKQIRVRAIQFGHREGFVIRPERVNDQSQNRRKGRLAEAVTTKTSKHVDFPDHCRKQGLEEPLNLPGWTRTAKFRAVGNGVPLAVGRAVAAAVACAGPPESSDCPCGCGRKLKGKQKSATPTCRKRLSLDRVRARPWVDVDGYHET